MKCTSAGKYRRRSGIAAVEAAVCLPLILAMLIGTWEVGRILEIQQFLEVGAREAARQAGSGLLTNDQTREIAIGFVRNALGNTSGSMTQNLAVTVTVYHASDPETAVDLDVSEAGALDLIVVEVSIPYADVRWINLPMLTSASMLKGQSTWVSLKNFPFPTTPPQPPTG
jgi:Flp pilus assembly protein TadG